MKGDFKMFIWNRFFPLTLISFFAVFLIGGCWGEKEQKLEKVSLRLQWIPQAQFAGVFVAEKKGFYKQKGIELEIKPGGGTVDPMVHVEAGRDDFGIWVADRLIVGRAQGMPLKAIAVIYQKDQVVFITREDSGISTPRDFAGKKVGIKRGDNTETAYIAMLKDIGVDRKQINEIPVTWDMNPFFNRKVDVWPSYIINEPLQVEEMGIKLNYIKPGDYGIRGYSDTLFTTDEMIKKNPALVKRFLEATLKGWNCAIDNPEEAVDITIEFVKKKFGIKLDRYHELAMLEKSKELIKPEGGKIGEMDRTVWSEMMQRLVNLDILQKEINIESVFTRASECVNEN